MNNLNKCPCKGSNLDKMIQPAILGALAEKELHGYKIIQRISETSMFNGTKPDPTGIYRYLKNMEGNGLITSSWDTPNCGPAKRTFKITKNGYKCLYTWILTLEDYKNAIETFLNETRNTISSKKNDLQLIGGNFMSRPRIIIIGGFLGAGKTTSILNLTRLLQKRYKNVGVITNDQGTQLVDTNFLSKENINVMEVTGGCFCCNFDSFSQKIDQMIKRNNPDIIISEPVGSCTDLIATIYRPMNHYSADKFALTPLSIVVDPKKVMQFLGSETQSLYPNEIKYLFCKQIEEADIIVLNKIDLLSHEELINIQDIIKKNFPNKELISISAKENINMDLWLEKIEGIKHKDDFTMDVNYQTYGKAEAYLGWLNTSVELSSLEKLDISAFIKEFMEVLKNKFNDEKLEIAHLKVYGVSNSECIKASLTGLSDHIDFNGQIPLIDYKANIIINARINTNPEKLEDHVTSVLNNISTRKNIVLNNMTTECFIPGQPNPKYRMSSEQAKNF